MRLELKEYQQTGIDRLGEFLGYCVSSEKQDPAYAFQRLTQEEEEGSGEALPYCPIKAEGFHSKMPYVCLRIPTGGGKTVMAASSIGTINRKFLQQERSVVLWFVPTDSIKEQTINALKNREHSYRLALNDAVGEAEILSLDEARYITPATFQTNTVVIVISYQAFRVKNTDNRKVYEDNGSLMSHFDIFGKLSKEQRKGVTNPQTGEIIHSLANILRLHRPILILDEAHNASSDLSMKTFARLNPSCIVEFTATPDEEKVPSNVIYSVSAWELKQAQMVKLPIILETTKDWQSLINYALSRREELEKIAKEEERKNGDYIRPILLVQAEAKSQKKETLHVDVLKKHLIEKCNLPESWIARAAGGYNEIKDVDLSEAECDIRVIITQSKLKEGWDCPFAYVLCSVAELGASTAVEQLLGRILRMPYAEERGAPELNQAYAYVASDRFRLTAESLKDNLAKGAGFNRKELEEYVKGRMLGDYRKGSGSGRDDNTNLLPLFSEESVAEIEISIDEKIDESNFSSELRGKIKVEQTEDKSTLTIPNNIAPEEEKEILNAVEFETSQTKIKAGIDKVRSKAWESDAGNSPSTFHLFPCESGEKFKIPKLELFIQGEFREFLDAEDFLYDWDISPQDGKATEEEISRLKNIIQKRELSQVDVSEEGKLYTSYVDDLQNELNVFFSPENWDESSLVSQLKSDISKSNYHALSKNLMAYLLCFINDSLNKHEVGLNILVKFRYALRDILVEKIKKQRKEKASRDYKDALFSEKELSKLKSVIKTSDTFIFDLPRYGNPTDNSSPHSHEFKHHYYEKIYDLDEDKNKPEYLCAKEMEKLSQQGKLKFWYRNPPRKNQYSFSLPRPNGNHFYPDFLAKTKDERLVAIEYKGGHLEEDEKDKKQIGEVWEKVSEGKCVFVWVTGDDYNVIERKITTPVRGGS